MTISIDFLLRHCIYHNDDQKYDLFTFAKFTRNRTCVCDNYCLNTKDIVTDMFRGDELYEAACKSHGMSKFMLPSIYNLYQIVRSYCYWSFFRYQLSSWSLFYTQCPMYLQIIYLRFVDLTIL